MSARANYYDTLTEQQRDDLAAELAAGPQPMQRMGAHWGDGTSVICAGDEAQMMRVAEVRFRQKFHAGPCPKGNYGDDHGGPPLPTIAERLSRRKRGEG